MEGRRGRKKSEVRGEKMRDKQWEREGGQGREGRGGRGR